MERGILSEDLLIKRISYLKMYFQKQMKKRTISKWRTKNQLMNKIELAKKKLRVIMNKSKILNAFIKWRIVKNSV